jgi:hypothetical protein
MHLKITFLSRFKAVHFGRAIVSIFSCDDRQFSASYRDKMLNFRNVEKSLKVIIFIYQTNTVSIY